MLSGPGPPPPPPNGIPPPPLPLPQARAAARTCPCCRLGQSGICAAVVFRTRHELQLLNYGLYGDGVGGSCSLMVFFDGTDDEDDDDKMTTPMMMFSMMSKMIRLSTRIAVWTQHHEQYHRQQAQLRTRPTKASAEWGCTATPTGGAGGGYHGVGGGGGVWQPCIIYIYIYIYMYVHIYIYIYTYIRVYLWSPLWLLLWRAKI